MDKRKLKKIGNYKCVLAFNNSEECYLFRSDKVAMEEAKKTLMRDSKNMEAYILDVKIKKRFKMKFMEM